MKPGDAKRGPWDILYVGFLLGHGGDAVQMLELATDMAGCGRRVKIIVPALETTQAFARHCDERGIAVERSPLLTADAAGAKQRLPGLLRLFANNRAPILHLHTGNDCLPRFAVLAMDLRRLPRAFVTVHSPYATLAPGGTRARQWAAAVSRRFHQVFCPSRHSRETQLRYGVDPARVQTIYNSVNVARFGQGRGEAARKTLGVGPDTPLIVFSSRLEAQKRPQDAVEAFRRVSAEFPAAHLAFIGRGDLQASLQAASRAAGLDARTHFLGHRGDVEDWLAAATVWHLPTESENFSLAVLEALAAGCPIVSTLCPGNDEVLIDERNALTTAVGDVTAQAEALRRLLRDSSLRARLSADARLTAGRYSVESMGESYRRWYDQALPQIRRAPLPAGEQEQQPQ